MSKGTWFLFSLNSLFFSLMIKTGFEEGYGEKGGTFFLFTCFSIIEKGARGEIGRVGGMEIFGFAIPMENACLLCDRLDERSLRNINFVNG